MTPEGSTWDLPALRPAPIPAPTPFFTEAGLGPLIPGTIILTRSEQHIDLRGIGTPVEGRELLWSVPVDLAPVHLAGMDYEVEIIGGEVELRVRVVGSDYLVDLSFEAMVRGVCMRCLEEVGEVVPVRQTEFVPGEEGGEDTEDEVSPFINDHVVDVRGLVREAVVLALPVKILCSEDCGGLCAFCGANLNRETCDCGEERIDPRLEALRDLDLGSEEEKD